MDKISKSTADTIKLLRKNIEETLEDIGVGEDFLGAQEIKAKLDECDCIKLRKASALQRAH